MFKSKWQPPRSRLILLETLFWNRNCQFLLHLQSLLNRKLSFVLSYFIRNTRARSKSKLKILTWSSLGIVVEQLCHKPLSLLARCTIRLQYCHVNVKACSALLSKLWTKFFEYDQILLCFIESYLQLTNLALQ